MHTDILESIDHKLSQLNDELTTYIESIDFIPLVDFTLDTTELIPWEKIKCSGIYMLEIINDRKFVDFTDWVTHFRKEWENEDYKAVPGLKKIRIKEHKELGDCIPLYIGKSKNIKGRIKGHIFLGIEQKTFALKLNARKNMKTVTFRLSYIPINANNYDWIVPKVESNLRNKYNPIVGRQ